MLPAIFSPTAHFVFPHYPKLHHEPSLADDKHGAAALAHAGFSMSTLDQFQRLVRVTHPLQAKRDEPPVVDEAEIIEAPGMLVERILNLDQTERAVMDGVDKYDRVEPMTSDSQSTTN